MDILERLVELRRRGEPVALATVVAFRPPTSARPGDRALVLANGELLGWVGGSCAQPTVQREALRALADGRPRLVRLSPEAAADPVEHGVVQDVMACQSGGLLEIYVEPFLPPPELLITGESPVADALATLGAFAGYSVIREMPADAADAGPIRERYVVVAGMAGDDDAHLERAVALDAQYLSLVGSRKRLAELSRSLQARGVPAERLERVKGPAGLDIGASSPEEIAVSILAEIISTRRRGSAPLGQPASMADDLAAPRAEVEEAIDPVCGMRVAVLGARHILERDGQRFYFCCPSCKRTFADESRHQAGTGRA